MILNAPTLADAAAEIVVRAEYHGRRRSHPSYDITSPSDPRHGTRAGYDAHLTAGTDACRPCLRGSARSTKKYEVASAQGISYRHPPCSVKRRLRALVALGYTYSHLDRELGTERWVWDWVNRDRAYYPHATYLRVVALYDRLSMVTPVALTKRDELEQRRARERAQQNGWEPPLAWDEDTLDDPTARPYQRREWGYLEGNYPVDKLQARAGILRDAFERQMTAQAAAREMGMSSKDTLEKWCGKHEGYCGVLKRMYRDLAARDGVILPDQRRVA